MSARWLLVHGWGFTPAIWSRMPPLPGGMRRVALPGHADAPAAPPEAWADRLLAALPEPPVIGVGWSLGGMLLLEAAARAPERFAGLVLVAAAASFVARPGFPQGVAPDALDAFAAPDAFPRFLLLALGARRDARPFLRTAPPAGVRAHGLALLRTLDLRETLRRLAPPTLWIAGARDAVLPAAAVAASARASRRGVFVRLTGAGHAPMWTHPAAFAETLRAWASSFPTP